MVFEIIGEVSEKTFPGQLIENRLKMRVLGKTRWVTKITSEV